jgi:hypothetical protein
LLIFGEMALQIHAADEVLDFFLGAVHNTIDTHADCMQEGVTELHLGSHQVAAAAPAAAIAVVG